MQIANAARTHNKIIGRTLVLKNVRGSTPFLDRPGVKDFIDGCIKEGIDQIMIPDEKRLARRLVVQEQALIECEKLGVRLEHSTMPGLFSNKDPHTNYMLQSRGAA